MLVNRGMEGVRDTCIDSTPLAVDMSHGLDSATAVFGTAPRGQRVFFPQGDDRSMMRGDTCGRTSGRIERWEMIPDDGGRADAGRGSTEREDKLCIRGADMAFEGSEHVGGAGSVVRAARREVRKFGG